MPIQNHVYLLWASGAIKIQRYPLLQIGTHYEPEEPLWSIRTHQDQLIPITKHRSHYYSSETIKTHWYPSWVTGAIVIHQNLLRSIDTHHLLQDPMWSIRTQHELLIPICWSTGSIIIRQEPSRPINTHQEPRVPFWSISNHQDPLIPTMSQKSHCNPSGPIKNNWYQSQDIGAIVIYLKPSRPIDTHSESQEPLWSIRTS